MADGETKKDHGRNRQWVRRSFVGVVLTSLTLFGAYVWYMVDSLSGGGQTVTSPDGKYMIVLWRDHDPSQNDPYVFTLRDYETGDVRRKLALYPVNHMPGQQLRGGPRVIEWDESSQFADLTLDGRHFLRVYVPE